MLAAAVTAGIATDRILFAGFLPNRSKARQDAIAEVRSLSATLVFYESTQRIAETLADGVQRAREALTSGRAGEVLFNFVQATQAFAPQA